MKRQAFFWILSGIFVGSITYFFLTPKVEASLEPEPLLHPEAKPEAVHRPVVFETPPLENLEIPEPPKPLGFVKIKDVLGSGDKEEKMEALSRLFKMGPDAIAECEEQLVAMMMQNDADLKSAALFAFSKNKDLALKHIEKVNDQLRSEDAGVVDSALHAISMMGAAAAESVVPVMGMLSNANPKVREDAAFALGRIGKNASASLELLLDLFDSDPSKRARLAYENAIRLIAGGTQFLTEHSTHGERHVFENKD